MVSKKIITVIGLNLTVYGLEEYQVLEKDTPVSVMFALHGRLQNQSKMESISQELCRLNDYRKKGENHLLIVTFDSVNHGSRLVDKLANFSWVEGDYRNPNHAMDMWTMVNSNSTTVSDLIDVLDYYLFGPSENYRVQVWGVLGFSMGGHAAFIAAANDSRITVAIPIVGISDFLALLHSRLEEAKLSVEKYLPKPIQTLISSKMANLDEKLKTKHILILNAENDELVKPKFNEPLVKSLQKIHVGKEGVDWKFYLVPGVGHEWSSHMVEASIDWTYQWMVKNMSESKL